MIKTPRLSIIMGTYNRASFLGAAIKSIQKQTFTDWELIIASDGSIDNTSQAVEEWKKKEGRIVFINNQANQGISKNYNTAFAIAQGEYIAMIDDDDPWSDPEKLEKQIKFLDEHQEYVGCGGGVIVIDGEGREKYRYLKPETDKAIRSKMLFGNPMANSTTVFRRDAAERVGWYDGSIRYSGDRDFWLKMGRIGKLYNFPQYFSYYTMTGHNTSIDKIKPHLKTSLMVMRRYKSDYPGYPLALVLNWLQYVYAFLPKGLRKLIHASLARLKRLVVG